MGLLIKHNKSKQGMRNIIKIAALMALLMVSFSTVQAQKFGYVNSTELLGELPELKAAEAELEALQKQLQKKGQGMVEQLQKDYQEIQQKIERGELSPKEQDEQAKSLETRQQAIAKFEQDMVGQIQNKRTQLYEPIYTKVNDAIAAVAKEQGYTFIFDKQILLYSEDTQDVSTLVKAKL